MSGNPPGTGAGQPLLNSGALAPPPYGSLGHHHHHHHHHPHSHRHGYHGVAYVPHVHFAPAIIQPRPTAVVVRGRPRYHFAGAFTFTILAWLLVCALIRGVNVLIHWSHGHRHEFPHWSIGPGSENHDYLVPLDTNLASCEEPLKTGYLGEATLEVPVSSDAVLLFANGAQLHGTVRVTTTTKHSQFVKVSVGLESRYNLEAYTIVCSLKRRDGEQGVGIFNPRRIPGRTNDVRYDVVVEFPQNHPVVKRFESSVVNSVYNIEDLQGKVSFEQLSLRGSNGNIHSESLFAQWADIETSNGRIDGYFNASDRLNLRTSNNAMDITIYFNQERSPIAGLSLTNSNAPIKAKFHLFDVTPSKNSSPNFCIIARTSNGLLDIAFLDAPVDSKLVHQASTSNAPAEVSLHPTFEGHFNLHSSFLGAVVHERLGVEDPSGKGRERHIRYESVRGPRVEGGVAWGKDVGGGKGSVDVGTSNSKVTLNL